MSETVLRLVPVSPEWTPSEVDADRAASVLRALCPDAADVLARFYEEVTFIDQGSNFERVCCPACTAVLEPAWWQERMDEAFATRFSALAVPTPCCAATVSLNDLRYDWPAGFARFELQIPGPGRDWLTAGELAQVEKALGTAVRQIFSRY